MDFKMLHFMARALNVLRRVKNAYCRRFVFCFYKVCHYLPLSKRTIVFESEGDFCDNAWVLYHYLRKKKKYKFVWVVEHLEKFEKSNDTVFLTRHGRGLHLRTMYHYATARFNFFTHWTFQPYMPRRGQTVVAIWHGTPLKASRYPNVDYYDYCVTTGHNVAKTMAMFMWGDEAKMIPLGYPRNDLLLNNIGFGRENPMCPAGVDKFLIWMPTFRASFKARLSEDNIDTETGLPLLADIGLLEEFNEFLKARNTAVMIKIHHLQAKKDVFSKAFSNIIMVTDDLLAEHSLQLYEVIGKSDGLITDYSSISVDYLLIDKPIGFILDDIDEYGASRGFVYENVREYLPGRHIYDIAGLRLFVDDIVSGTDAFKEDRHRLKTYFHETGRADSCHRICEYFGL